MFQQQGAHAATFVKYPKKDIGLGIGAAAIPPTALDDARSGACALADLMNRWRTLGRTSRFAQSSTSDLLTSLWRFVRDARLPPPARIDVRGALRASLHRGNAWLAGGILLRAGKFYVHFQTWHYNALRHPHLKSAFDIGRF
jgi:hypothetical protein